ncbi:MAG TPA: hypothetical protein VHJ78_04670 [Actinomycetota bacterium]|nr:hypothetical protein [Actinomycetota bacterium]
MGAFKTGAIVGFGLGYMQGAKAGRQRYEQIQSKMKKVADSPAVKKAVEPIKPMVSDKLESGKEMMGSVMSKAAGVKGGSSTGKPGASASTVETVKAGTAASNTAAGTSNDGV